MKNPQFLVGEYVNRTTDNVGGRVTEIQEYEGEFIYRVELDRRGDDNDVIGTASAWTRYYLEHAHITTESQDCDGRYTRSEVIGLTATERCSLFGNDEFRERVLLNVVDVSNLISMDVEITRYGIRVNEPTEEGFRNSVVEWCEDTTCSGIPSTQRDHRAEAMGY